MQVLRVVGESGVIEMGLRFAGRVAIGTVVSGASVVAKLGTLVLTDLVWTGTVTVLYGGTRLVIKAVKAAVYPVAHRQIAEAAASS